MGSPANFSTIAAEPGVALERGPVSRPLASTARDLNESIRFCGEVARREARNFYWSFRLLPRRQRQAMCVLYAFMRRTDDLADSPLPSADREAALAAWKARLDQVLDNRPQGSVESAADEDWPGFTALADTVERYAIPRRYLHAVIDGMAYDLHPVRLKNTAEFEAYCWHVASAVGLCCLHIWGYESRGGRAEKLAETLGLAFQRTNILRDIAEDHALDRVYLPADLLETYGITDADLAAASASAGLRKLVADQSEIARRDYRAVGELLPLISPECRPMLRAISRIYEAVLDAIETQRFDVLSRRARVPKWRKMAIMVRSVFC